MGAPTSGMYIPVVDPAEASPVNQNKRTLLSSLGSAVTFTQSGTGAVSRSLNSKLQDVISVKDFGAKGDTVTNDSPAIQAAINAAQASGIGGTVYFPPGTYRLEQTITVTGNNIFLVGSGMWNTILYRGNVFTGTDIVSFSGNTATGSTIQNVGIKHLSIRNTVRMDSGANLSMVGVARFDVESIFTDDGFINMRFAACSAGAIRNTYSLGLNLYGGSGTNRAFVEFGNNTNFTPSYCGDVFVSDFNWRGNLISPDGSSYQDGLRVVCCDGVWFSNGHIGNSSLANIHIKSENTAPLALLFFSNVMSDEGTAHGCLIEGSTSPNFFSIKFTGCEFKSGGIPAICPYGIAVASGCTVDELQFSNCLIQEYGNNGVTLLSQNSGVTTFDGCVVKGNGRSVSAPGYFIADYVSNVYIVGGTSGRAWNNAGVGTQTYGIQIGNFCNYITVNGVDLTGNVSGTIIADGSSSVVEVNNCILGNPPTVTSASTIIPPTGYRYFFVDGTTAIGNIQITQLGRVITMIFKSNITVNDAIGNIKLNGTFNATPDDSLTLLYDGSFYIELSRSTN